MIVASSQVNTTSVRLEQLRLEGVLGTSGTMPNLTQVRYQLHLDFSFPTPSTPFPWHSRTFKLPLSLPSLPFLAIPCRLFLSCHVTIRSKYKCVPQVQQQQLRQ
jgi:ABC-type antimicrobial peptide transport system ATPase subunit